jgi:acyl dehydratase
VSEVKRAAELEAIRRKLISLTAYRQLLNGPEQVSDWLLVDQSMIDTFADATHDHQFIHIDRQRAESETPFGGTIAHGFLTLSLLSALAFDAMPEWVSTTGSSVFVS